MKKTVLIPSAVLLAFAALPSCKKAASDTVTSQTIDATVVSNQSLQLSLGTASAKQSVSISSQAAHAESSSVQKNISAGKTVYLYTPASNYVGTDKVVITSVNDSTHTCQPGSKVTTVTTVNLTVTK